ncbi:RING finger protein 212b [Plakobranchus ocellatus]|uniref:RING finger protein 212b n=1 Tax=Plakobranchus ocellatus TaxID=259542 RepID=A0AAV4CT53_9GAST|nr:RING finger protein 212b [Plakobranchus ocellatus]
MANYLHCNACYFRPGMGIQRRFFITNCSHIYCETCVTAATKDKCKICKSQCSTLCLSGKIPKEVESMFVDPVESIQKFLKEFCQKLEFQRSHQRRLMRHMTEQLKCAEKKMSEVNKMIQRAQQLERSFTALQHRPGGGTNIPSQTGRLLIRTPPSGGRLGELF